MRLPLDFESVPWLESPLKTAAGAITLAGTLKDSPGIGTGGMRILGSHALVLLLDGTGRYRDARGRDRSLGTGDVIHVFPDIAHAYGPGRGERWNELYVVFEGPVFATLSQCGLLPAEHPVDRLDPVEEGYRELESLLHPRFRGSAGTEAETVGRFLGFLFRVAGARGRDPAPAAEDRPIAEAMDWLATPRAGRWLAPDEAARRVGLTPETFRKRFARKVGLPPARYQRQKKIERACAVLYQGSPSLKQLAADLGFFDEFHFSKAFKQAVGQSPSAYRRRLAGA